MQTTARPGSDFDAAPNRARAAYRTETGARSVNDGIDRRIADATAVHAYLPGRCRRGSAVGGLQVESVRQIVDLVVDGGGQRLGERHVLMDRLDLHSAAAPGPMRSAGLRMGVR
jgi:hypothetical protein